MFIINNYRKNISLMFTISIVLMPILNSYVSPIRVLGLGEFLLILILPIMLIYIIINNIRFYFSEYWLYIIYGIFSTYFVVLLNKISFSEVNNRLFRNIFYAFIIFVLGQIFFDFELGSKIYKYVVLLACIFLILQLLSYILFDVIIPWKLPGIDFNINISMEEYFNKYKTSYRPTSFFTEPAHFVQYCTPYLAIILFKKIKLTKLDFMLSFFITIIILTSTSVNGFIFILVIWGLWSFYNLFIYNKRKNALFIFLSIYILPIVLFGLYNFIDGFKTIIDRIVNITNDISSIIRLVNGFIIFSQLDLLYKFIGIGFGSYDEFKELYPITLLHETKVEYMSSLSYLLVSSGILGFIFYLLFMLLLFKRSNILGKVLIILSFFMFFSSSIYSSPMFALLFVFVLSSKKNNSEYIIMDDK